MEISFSFTHYANSIVVDLKWISPSLIEHVKRTFYSTTHGVSGVYRFRVFVSTTRWTDTGVLVCQPTFPSLPRPFGLLERPNYTGRAIGLKNRHDVLVPWEVFETCSCRYVIRREVASMPTIIGYRFYVRPGVWVYGSNCFSFKFRSYVIYTNART